MATRSKGKRARYTEEFKAKCLRALETRVARTFAEVAEGLGVPEYRLHGWKRAARESGSSANDRGESMEQVIRRLRRELAEAKKDRDVLSDRLGGLFVRDFGCAWGCSSPPETARAQVSHAKVDR